MLDFVHRLLLCLCEACRQQEQSAVSDKDVPEVPVSFAQVTHCEVDSKSSRTFIEHHSLHFYFMTEVSSSRHPYVFVYRSVYHQQWHSYILEGLGSHGLLRDKMATS